jgi:predicted transcriptional regulator
MLPESMDAVFQALSNGNRRRMIDVIRNSPGCNVNEVCAHFKMSRIAVMKHLRMLEAAKLITSVKEGRVRKMFFNEVPIQMIHDRWTSEYGAIWAARMTQIKYRVESRQDTQPNEQEELGDGI